MEKLRVVVNGAYGKMGRTALQAVLGDGELELSGAVGRDKGLGQDAGLLAGGGAVGVELEGNLGACLGRTGPDVVVDFTHPAAVKQNISAILAAGAHAVVGTTGISDEDIPDLERQAAESGRNVLVAPNFALGAVLMVKMAALAARYFPDVEVIETHHTGKADAPSGTAVKTAELMGKLRRENPMAIASREMVPGSRGGQVEGVPVHSVRLPGFVARQEVVFGGTGQNLTICHTSISRDSFIPGISMGIKRVPGIDGVVYGFENLLEE